MCKIFKVRKMGKNIVIFAGVISMLQAIIQIIIGTLSIAQYFCFVDFLRNNRELLLIKILYFTNTETCGRIIQIGNVFDGIANQAFIMFEKEQFLSTRTFAFSVAYTTLGWVWCLAAGMLLGGGAGINRYSSSFRWAWVTASICVGVVDIVAALLYANDSFYTQTLQDIAQHIGATVSGIGGVTVDTSATSWIMFAASARLLVVLIMNIVLAVVVALQNTNQRQHYFHENDTTNDLQLVRNSVQSEPQPVAIIDRRRNQEQLESSVNSATYIKTTGAEMVRSNSSTDEFDNPEGQNHIWPRAYLNRAYRNMKEQLLKRTSRDNTRNTMVHERLPWVHPPTASARQRDSGSSDDETPPLPFQDLSFNSPSNKPYVQRASSRPRLSLNARCYY